MKQEFIILIVALLGYIFINKLLMPWWLDISERKKLQLQLLNTQRGILHAQTGHVTLTPEEEEVIAMYDNRETIPADTRFKRDLATLPWIHPEVLAAQMRAIQADRK